MSQKIYLDHNATTPVCAPARDAMLRALREPWGNPSSVHWAGAAARAAVEQARAQVATAIGVRPDTITFTSGATESINTVLLGAVAGDGGGEIVLCTTEHPASLETAQALRTRGVEVRLLEVGRDGRLAPELFASALSERTRLASVMWVNNETGVIQPIAELSRIARERGVPFHTDAAQALGKLSLDLARLDVDFASFSAHKLGGPQGVGALYCAGRRVAPLLRGGAQERGTRPGTENVPGIVGFGAACVEATDDLDLRATRLARLRDSLWSSIEKTVSRVHRNGSAEHVVSQTLNVSFPGAPAETLVEALDLAGIAVSSGTACHSGSSEPSHVLRAMGLESELCVSAIRLSFGASSRTSDVDVLLEILPRVVERVREAHE